MRDAARDDPTAIARLEDDGTTMVTEVRVNRGTLIGGLFYGLDGMRVGGTRRLEIARVWDMKLAGSPG